MIQTAARRTLKDAPIMWRRINSIGIILDCNSTYAEKMLYAKSEIIGKPIFAHVPRGSWDAMTRSLTKWFETGEVTDQKIIFLREDGSTFPGLLQATSIYDHAGALMGSNTAIFDLDEMSDGHIATYARFIKNANQRLAEIGTSDYDVMNATSRSEYNGLRKMFKMLAEVDLGRLRQRR